MSEEIHLNTAFTVKKLSLSLNIFKRIACL